MAFVNALVDIKKIHLVIVSYSALMGVIKKMVYVFVKETVDIIIITANMAKNMINYLIGVYVIILKCGF